MFDMPWYLVTYEPLCFRRAGQRAIEQHGYAPFVDFSCRREPDLEAKPPAISALCRKQWFAPRLEEGDVVVYLSKKGSYGTHATPFWYLVAVLKVRKTFSSHPEAAAWYRQRRRQLPRNCVVTGNRALPLSHTGRTKADLKKLKLTLAGWKTQYLAIASDFPEFVACTRLSVRLHRPRVLAAATAERALGHAPITQTPKAEPARNVRRLLAAAGMRVAGREQRRRNGRHR